jgi:hypothetical protein
MKVIQAAMKKGDMHSRDFNKFPLPALSSEEIPKQIPKQITQITLTDQEIRNREKRKGRFSDSVTVSTKPNSGINIEEIPKSIVIVVFDYNFRVLVLIWKNSI